MTTASQTVHEQARLFMEVVPHVQALGLRFVDVGEDWITIELPYGPHLVGFPDTGIIAGGAIFSLMDNASGLAVHAKLGGWRPQATLDLRIDYLKPATPGRSVFGHARCYKLTRRVAFVRGVAYHDDPERPIANTTGTFMLSED